MHVLALFPDMSVFDILIIISPCKYIQTVRTWFSCGNVKVLLVFKYIYFSRETEEYKGESSDRLAVPVHSSLHLCFIRKCLVNRSDDISDSLWLHVYKSL